MLALIKGALDADRVGGRFLSSRPLTIAMNYTFSWLPELLRDAEPGNRIIEIAENAIGPSAIGKENWLFIGHPKAGQAGQRYFASYRANNKE